MSGGLIVLAAAGSGWLGALAVREAVVATPALRRAAAGALEPLWRAGREGYLPTVAEQRRLAVIGAAVLLLGGLWFFGPLPAPVLAVGGPGLAAAAVARRRERYRRAVERSMPQVATELADAIGAGRSVRAALAALGGSVEGPAGAEMARLRAELELGLSVADALASLRGRLGSARVDALTSALVSQGLGGGDIAGLLRRFAAAAAAGDRAIADARSATAQARFTGLLVVAMPTGAALFAELISPGFIAGLLAEPLAAGILVGAAVLQALGFVAIRRLSRIEAT
ncbi:hypothetical protein HJD18_06270 [Thermoleophilia bacterium SCSIO 60948]|nr:hypothetical protein HJD18_06270 [Thermoleophilia bacterium SCSIO 60948]